MSKTFNQPASGIEVLRLGGMPTFMQLPHSRDPADNVPWGVAPAIDPGARQGHGRFEINHHSFVQFTPATKYRPFGVCKSLTRGDTSANAILPASKGRPAALSTGDYLTTLPILHGTVTSRPVGLRRFDAHTVTKDTDSGANRYVHGPPFGRTIEENPSARSA